MKIRVIAGIVDTKRLTMYTETGEQYYIEQGDPRLKVFVEELNEKLAIPGSVAEIDYYKRMIDNPYQEFEKQSKTVRFFRVLKEKVAALFTDPVEPQAIGSFIKPKADEPVKEARPETVVEPVTVVKKEVLNEIMKHAVPASSPEFHTDDIEVGDEDKGTVSNDSVTVIAMVDNKIIPNAHKLAPQIRKANQMSDPVAVEMFMSRISKIIDQRNHSVEDLLKFIERGDLPLAKDGSIIIFKVLKNLPNGRFVDCHTKKVNQGIGSYVHMDANMVDPDRRNECSNGLHVARRNYIRNFSGDVCVIAKLAPEDVIAVPDYDANKMRVMGYHILFRVSDEGHKELRNNRPLSRTEDLENLTRAINGDHPPIKERVHIQGQYGNDVVITPVDHEEPVEVSKVKEVITPIQDEDIDVSTKLAPVVDPKQVAKTVEKTKTLSRQEKAQNLLRAVQQNASIKEAKELLEFKQKAKVSWESLGVSVDDVAQINRLVSIGKAAGTKEKEPARAKVKVKTSKPVDDGKKLSYREQMHKVLCVNKITLDVAEVATTIKSKAKKGWSALGVDAKTQAEIERLVKK